MGLFQFLVAKLGAFTKNLWNANNRLNIQIKKLCWILVIITLILLNFILNIKIGYLYYG